MILYQFVAQAMNSMPDECVDQLKIDKETVPSTRLVSQSSRRVYTDRKLVKKVKLSTVVK